MIYKLVTRVIQYFCFPDRLVGTSWVSRKGGGWSRKGGGGVWTPLPTMLMLYIHFNTYLHWKSFNFFMNLWNGQLGFGLGHFHVYTTKTWQHICCIFGLRSICLHLQGDLMMDFKPYKKEVLEITANNWGTN